MRLDLSRWELSLPTTPLTNLSPAQLATFDSAVSPLGGYFVNQESGVSLTCPFKGGTTTHSDNTRVEFRQVNLDGTKCNWDYSILDTGLLATLNFTHIPLNGRVVIGQIHEFGHDTPPIKLQYTNKASGGTVRVQYRTEPDGPAIGVDIIKGLPLGEPIEYNIHIVQTGEFGITVNGTVFKAYLLPSWKAYLMYFKAGLYLQNDTVVTNPEMADDYVSATFSKLNTYTMGSDGIYQLS